MTASIHTPAAAGEPGGSGPLILLVSPDLMSTSRLAGLAQEAGGRLETLRTLDAPLPGGPYDLVLLDIQAPGGDPAALVTQVRSLVEQQPSPHGIRPRIVAFGPHVARERLEQALAAGADASVSRGELLGGFHAILRRWTG